ncbi:MAG: class I SAM-dependent methyltransferase [Thermoleophilia bacterium]|nr:class I SAM-dependent methyltransferase [Thermoleophilia bacterium]
MNNPSSRASWTASVYDRIGLNYSQVRRPDPRFEAAIWNALGSAKSVLNVGAGCGSYEPADREVTAVEPSPVMIAQRPESAAPAIQGAAEALPLRDKSVDATMCVFTMQHWDNVQQGLDEVLRVTCDRVVILTVDPDVMARMWLCNEYLPEIGEHDRHTFPSMEYLEARLPHLHIGTVPVPADCTDGFCIAFWNRPEAILDPRVRQASSIWHLLPAVVVEEALARLHRDLESGDWDRRFGQLRRQAALDVGLRLAVSELT